MLLLPIFAQRIQYSKAVQCYMGKQCQRILVLVHISDLCMKFYVFGNTKVQSSDETENAIQAVYLQNITFYAMLYFTTLQSLNNLRNKVCTQGY